MDAETRSRIQKTVGTTPAAIGAYAGDQLRAASFPGVTSRLDSMRVVDFGLDNLPYEGVQILDLLFSETVRFSILTLTPYQTLPEHVHPSTPLVPGKHETFWCLSGTLLLYLPGRPSMLRGFIPDGKESFYTVRSEHVLAPGEQLTVVPGQLHWAQAGKTGAVFLTIQNRVDESLNRFSDPDADPACVLPGQ